MKKMMAVLIFIALFSMAMTCNKDGNYLSIQGFHLTDALGNNIGHYGPADDDWTLLNNLSEAEMEFFNFNVTATLDNTAQGSLGALVAAYPNPCSNLQRYMAQSSDSVLLKLAIVNGRSTVLKTAFLKFKNVGNLEIDLSDRSIFGNKSSLRVYYSFSAQGKPNFKVGFG